MCILDSRSCCSGRLTCVQYKWWQQFLWQHIPAIFSLWSVHFLTNSSESYEPLLVRSNHSLGFEISRTVGWYQLGCIVLRSWCDSYSSLVCEERIHSPGNSSNNPIVAKIMPIGVMVGTSSCVNRWRVVKTMCIHNRFKLTNFLLLMEEKCLIYLTEI